MTNQSFFKLINPLSIFLSFHAKRELLLQFTKRNIQSEIKGSYLGIVWTVFTPLLSFAVYATVFGVIFNGRYRVVEDETGVHYAMGIFLSLNIFRLLADSISMAPGLIYSQPNYVKKVVFPLEIIPMAAMAANIYRFTVAMVLCLIGIFLMTDRGFTLDLQLFPLLIFPIYLLGQGLAWLMSALGVFMRDIGQVTQAVTMILLYSSAVFYSTQMVQSKGPAFWAVLRFNPLIHIVEQSRNLLLWQTPLDFAALAYCYLIGSATFLLGYLVFMKIKPAFADVI
mgnify:CR=1 FL=1